jgi:hypothetical protein
MLLIAGSAAGQTPVTPKSVEQVLPLVNRYCGACHAVPRPDVQVKANWPTLVRIMVEITQKRTGRAQLTEEQMHDIIAFYYGSAPEQLPKLPVTPDLPASRAFTASTIGARSRLPFVTHVNAGRVTGGDVELLVCDGEARTVLLLQRHRGAWKETRLADVDVPAHTQLVDMDADGDHDVLVADLGQLPPLDAPVGKVWWLRQIAPGKFAKELVLEGLGRVSDARAVDLDGDEDLDIVVAVFGGGDQGEIFWLENDAAPGQPAHYQRHPLLNLSGAVSIVPADLNGDGRMDLVTLIAQEHEMIVAFTNLGGGKFEQGTIARAPHPMYGSTSLATVDLDRDGDVDLLFTNGDAFDAQTDPKPYHGVQWLENKGGLKFEYRDVGRFYGAATAAAGDLDADGDLDIVAGSWVSYWNEPGRHAVVWFENDGKQIFTPHGLIDRPAGVASLQLADLDGDGALDIVAGAIRMDLLLTGMGSSYRASRLFPPADGSSHSRIVVLEKARRR